MGALSRFLTGLGVILILSGSVGAVLSYDQHSKNQCESGYQVRITQLGSNEEPRFTKPEVAFENLSATEQRVFEEIVAADEPPVYQSVSALTGIEREVVTYQGGRYETSGLTAHDCEAEGLVLMYMGILTALGGVGLVALPYLWRGGTRLLSYLRR